ncbi:MAG: CtsR family transcriptional regulator [Selenomonadaceae bacterium]|nr:CtsR family transcriptional regulator [Selenomonadaceae bacterium]
MVNNLSDAIEEYILARLSEQSSGVVELKRTELADKIDCAPSQISYVLSTRFTHERGFVVESRRGLGGYIRITILNDADIRDLIYRDMLSKINENTELEYIRSMVDYLLKQKMITRREAILLTQTIITIYESDKIDATERVRLMRSIFTTLSKFS